MKDRLYIATFSEQAEEVIREYGLNIELNELCISENLDADQVETVIALMRRQIEESDASSVIMHGPFTEIIPASIDHRAVELGMTRLEEAYQVCQQMGVRRMVVHSGYMPLLYFKEWHHDKSVYFWRRFMEDKPESFQICIENVFEDEPMMLKKMIEAIGHPQVKLCLDVGHANAFTDDQYSIFDWIRILGPEIGHFHLHNNDGSRDAHGGLTEGNLDMEAVLAAAETYCSPDVTMTIESRTCRESAAWLCEYADRKNRI